MKFDALTNEGEYFPSFYLDEILPKQLKTGRLKEWAADERQGRHTPRQGLRDLSGPYLDVRLTVGGEAGKFNLLPDPEALAAQQSATEALKAHSAHGARSGTDELPPFQPEAAPRSYGDSPEETWRAGLYAWHARVLRALGFTPNPGHLTVHGAAGPVAVPVAHSEPGIAVLTGGFADDIAQTRGEGSANRLPAPVRVTSGKTLTTVTDLAAWLLAADNAPRYALLLFGGVMVLADRESFARGRHLAVSLEIALPRKGVKGATAGELEVIAALFGAQSLRPAEDGGDDDIARLVAESRDHSVGVTSDLREGLKKSVQLIANEVLELAGKKGVRPGDLPEWLPKALPEPGALPRLLTKESLRYLYRILFLLYAEARPELDILPMKSDEYVRGYSVARLRELVVQEKLSSTSRDRHHFHDSLALLFEKVFTGHPVADTITSRGAVRDVADEAPLPEAPQAPEMSEQSGLAEDDGYEGVRIEALKSRLFDPASIKLVDQVITHPDDIAPDGTVSDSARRLDLRLRNKVLHQVLRNLTVTEGRGRGGRGGFISYANLSINHLGAVYEGLMSYTGFIADEPLYEVAKGGDPSGGSWLIRASQVASGRYPDGPDDSVFVGTELNPETNQRVPVPRKVDSYVYRLAGRDRQTSASYYTPESLTQATVEQTLRFRLDEKGEVDPKEPEKAWVNAADVLRWRVCEPALGSGAFLNEAVNQLAELYLRLAQRERGVEIDPEDYQRELQKVKAYIALHNAYGVDLNETAVELAEISLWLNTMYRGMKAPWYGLHLHRGNSLIGAARKVYPGNSLRFGGWLTTKDPQRPRHVPLGEKLKAREVHQFLLPAMGWGSIGEKVSVRTFNKGKPDEFMKAVVDGDVVDWLEPELVEAMRKWRSAMRRNPKGGTKRKAPKMAAEPLTAQEVALKLADDDARLGQGAFDLGFEIWEQPSLGLAAAESDLGTPERARASVPAAATDEDDTDTGDSGETTQTGRLMRLARRVEYLWDLVVMRLKLSEQEISRHVDVWGASIPRDGEQGAAAGQGTGQAAGEGSGRAPMDRDAVLEALHRKGTPYWRLKQLMDAWCALWFWPLEEIGLLDGSDEFEYHPNGEDRTALRKDDPRRRVALKSLNDWLEFAEAVVGRVDVDTGEGQQGSFLSFEGVKSLDQLDDKEHELDEKMTETLGWAKPADLGYTFPWYETVQRIAEERGFFHWELDFAHVFAEGGFDLMVGNPPWVRQEWDENGVLAEIEPWFVLGGKEAEANREENVAEALAKPEHRSFYLGELGTVAGVSEFLSSADTYPELVGTRPDMYRAFMLLAWRATGARGTAGLIHPATHLTGAKERALRRAAYEHLRLHADFANERKLFAPPVHHSTHFSMNVYGRSRDVRFEHVNWLFLPGTLPLSLKHDGSGPLPEIVRDETWDVRPHRKRITVVTHEVLEAWQKLLSDEDTDAAEAKALFPVTTAEDSAMAALARWPHRLGAQLPRISPGFNETKDRAPATGFFTWHSGVTKSWRDVILQPRFFSLATPLTAQPTEGASVTADMEPFDLQHLEENAVPRTHYRPVSDWATYARGLHKREWLDHELLAALREDDLARAGADAVVADGQLPDQDRSEAAEAVLKRWATRPWTDFYRVAWRRRTPSDYARNLTPALVPPGAAHIHQVHSLAMADNRATACVAGFWSSLPLEYFLRITERDDLQVREAEVMPAPTPGHPLTGALLLRTLRLNCQTAAYARLWEELFDESWLSDAWAASAAWPEATPPLTTGVGPMWTRNTPLRSEFDRRAALVELDALVAVWLGISSEQLEAMYVARFPAMRRQEEHMWFDAKGRRIAKKHQVYGYGQAKDAWKKLSSPEAFPEEYEVPDGYTGPLYRAHRKHEMRAAHAEFTRRLREAGWEPGDTRPPGDTEG
ncbi:Eco57I restriction-modification methylase domain-containing protein [Streptomyces ipomoeae]|uniref:Eco57I restriction-modification methylase domain-containing protein n=1 Tax=Streptomyces ipomoeae TaxID=103232 RepID=UPI001146513D|nr:DNA methyltransferase [Streptomyces ipomoeae]MDX2936495.1 class I SAM-dependent DNA methyltransferase [Streptomyces ipomoeae]TQE14936.1 class I SAM-dependent DNA methyltransferase [Streptomyces ipomoeae]